MITADDYGMSPSINQAIEALIEVGVVEGCSVMILGDIDPERLTQMRRDHNIQIGLHLDLNHFIKLKVRNIILIYIYSCLSPKFCKKIKRQIIHQVAQFEQHFGYLPDYVDGHQHCQMLQPVIETVIELITHPKKQFWIRNSASHDQNIKAILIRMISYRNWKKSLKLRNVQYRNLFGVYNFISQKVFLNKLNLYDYKKMENSNFMVHPCIDTSYGKFRKNEFDILLQRYLDQN